MFQTRPSPVPPSPSESSGLLTVAHGTMIPGVARLTMDIPGATVTLSHYRAREGCEVRRLSPTHLLTFLLSPMRLMNTCAIPDTAACEYLETGYMSLLPANIPYRTVLRQGDIKSINLRIDPAYFDQLTGIGQAWDRHIGFDIRNAFLESQLWQLAREMAEPGLAAKAMVEGLSLSIMTELARVIKDRQQKTEQRPGGLSAAQMRAITDYIQEAREYSPTISDIAGLIGVSARHLTKAFKLTTGQTVHDYVADVRIRKAATLLSSTELPMKEVSARLGFSQLANFSKAFRAATGQTPTAFRKVFQKRAETLN